MTHSSQRRRRRRRRRDRHYYDPIEATGRDAASLRIVIKPTFMLGYDRRDGSVITDPELLAELAAFLTRLGCRDIVVAEGPMIYGHFFRNRSVRDVAAYFGITSPHFRLADLSEDQVEHRYDRGMAQHELSKTWTVASRMLSAGENAVSRKGLQSSVRMLMGKAVSASF